MSKLPFFLDTVSQAWSEAGDVATNYGDLCYKVKRIKRALKALCRENFSDIKKEWLRLWILSVPCSLLLHDPSTRNFEQEKQESDLWLLLRSAEESFLRHRSRVKWLAEGDFNTSFFHNYTKIRNAINVIKHILKEDGLKTTSIQEVHEIAVEYFQIL